MKHSPHHCTAPMLPSLESLIQKKEPEEAQGRMEAKWKAMERTRTLCRNMDTFRGVCN